MAGLHWALVLSAFGLGFRHGFDWDHVAAIGDLTSSGTDRRRSTVSATVYALGHAAVILVLGTLAIVAGDYLPAAIDSAMGVVVGVTLLALGVYTLHGLVTRGRAFRVRSRWSIVAAAARRRRPPPPVVIEHDHDHEHGPDGSVLDHGHRHQLGGQARTAVATKVHHHHRHVHVGSLPPDPQGPSRRAAFGVGMLHGVGAETPTQVVLLVTAASAGGVVAGELSLVAFTVGLLIANTVVALAATAGLFHAEKHFAVYATVTAVVATFSIALGLTYLAGLDLLP